MKKIKTTIFLVTMLLFSIVLPKQSYGQFPSHVYKGTNYDLGLIRNCDANTSIACHVGNGQYYLSKIEHINYYLNNNTFYPNASTLSTYFTQMVDMCICGNYVFVCGRGKYGDGLIGYMKISDIGFPVAPNFAGTQNANFIFLQSGGIPYNARLLFYPSIEFGSLDCFNIQYFISCAPHNIYFQDCAVPVPYNPTCIQENDISVKIMPTVSFTPVYSPLLAASCLGSMDTVLQNWISLQFDYDCHNN